MPTPTVTEAKPGSDWIKPVLCPDGHTTYRDQMHSPPSYVYMCGKPRVPFTTHYCGKPVQDL